MLLWFSAIVASLSWFFTFPHYISSDPTAKWGLLGAALVLAVAGFREHARKLHLGRGYLWLLLPLLLSLFIAPPSYRAPFLVLAAGVLLSFAGSRFGKLSALNQRGAAGVFFPALKQCGAAALFLGGILIVQTPVYWLVTAWSARNPDVPFAAPVLYPLLKWVGGDVSRSGGSLFIRSMHHVHKFNLTWGHLALFPFLLIWVAGAVVIWWDRARHSVVRRLTSLSLVLIGYAVFRLFIVLCMFITAMLFEEHGSEKVHVELFWLPWITVATMLPLVPLVSWLVPLRGMALNWGGKWGPRNVRIATVVAGCVACLGLVLGLRFPDPGSGKKGRVLIDEAHSRWERTDKAYTTDWYGPESGYNYYCIAQYLKHFYELESNMEGGLTSEKLSGCDVLILKNPTEPYSDPECEAIEEFVRGGGGVFLLGEHTDVFGTSTCLNKVARRFGISFRPDAVFDIERKWEQVHFTSELCSHPIVARVPFFRFAVTCSIDSSSWNVRPVMRSTGLWTLPIEYAAGNFYPQVEDKAYAGFGAMDQMVSTACGRGRVVGFTDSTVYSNFLAFYPGKPEVFLNTVQWLNRSNKYGWVGTLGLVLFVLGGAVTVLLCALNEQNTLFSLTVIVAVAAAGWSALWGCSVLGKAFYPEPEPAEPVSEIVFDMGHSGCELPVFGFPQERGRSYQVFYQWVLRCGFFPKISFNLEEALKEGRPAVIVNPSEKFQTGTSAAVKEYLKRGGSLLVLDSPGRGEEEKPVSNDLLSRFGLSVGQKRCKGNRIIEPGTGTAICNSRSHAAVEGGEVLLETDAGEPVASFVRVGEGRIIACGLAERFVDNRMGYTWRSIPDYELRAVYELEFTLLRALVNGDPKEEFAALGNTYAE